MSDKSTYTYVIIPRKDDNSDDEHKMWQIDQKVCRVIKFSGENVFYTDTEFLALNNQFDADCLVIFHEGYVSENTNKPKVINKLFELIGVNARFFIHFGTTNMNDFNHKNIRETFANRFQGHDVSKHACFPFTGEGNSTPGLLWSHIIWQVQKEEIVFSNIKNKLDIAWKHAESYWDRKKLADTLAAVMPIYVDVQSVLAIAPDHNSNTLKTILTGEFSYEETDLINIDPTQIVGDFMVSIKSQSKRLTELLKLPSEKNPLG